MKKISKWIKVTLLGTAVVVILGSLAVYGLVNKRPTPPSVAADSRPYQWNKVELGEQVRSSDGSKYHLLTRTGENRNWIIFFSGGGVSWDAQSAAHPIKIMNFLTGKDAGNYFANIPFYLLNLLGGMTDTEHADNPFKEWNVVYIPYSTGDFHIGSRKAEYTKEDGSPFTMNYNGRSNVESSLEWIYAHVDNPEKLLIAGESAGGFGSSFWAGAIAEHYKEAQIYQYSDSSFLYSDKWPDIIDKEWQADFAENFGYPAQADLIGAAFQGNRRKLPENAVLLQSYSLYDEVLISFQNRINGEDGPLDLQMINTWSQQMRESVRQLDSSLPNYYYYLTDDGRNPQTGTTSHTFATRDVFYTTKQDGIRLVDWLDDIVNKQSMYSVGHEFIEQTGEE
ncbi:pectin acetylesterase-family hydrolase [Paenibacillus donghaensis]|uniref:Pectinacetylesterase n=1 Tax=Paenibacillus donghaensis TaxID=414771 RepID=A0A2Z2KEY7_9BACL|nr:pectin acetylesterase-family hydrolase [Paenibacillus donghaensis]ASA22505.1 hypothetical protein B9T62_17980 [Paenibacillus donghaensis]